MQAARPRPIVLMLVYERYERDSRVRRHVRALVAGGYDVRIVGVGGREAEAAALADGGRLRSLGAAKYRGGSRLAYVLAYAGFTFRALIEVARMPGSQLAVVWVNAPPDVLVFAAVPARLRRIPVVLDVHDITSQLFEAKFGAASRLVARLIRLVETAAYRFASAIVTVHAPYRDQIQQRVPGKPVIDVLNVPDEQAWYEEGRARAARPIGRARTALRVGHHGTIAERFGVDLAVRGVAALHAAGTPVRLSILGDGDYAPAIEELIDSLDARDVISFDRRTFLPDEIPAFVAGVDVGVAPYHESQFVDSILPVKVLEYLALGVPAIATSTSVLRAYLPADTVTYVSPASAETVRDAIASLVDADRRAAFARAGVEALAGLSWTEQRLRLLMTIDALIAGRKPGKP
jgi:glycosyltransferase involved in cell wall biosynthesis